MCRPTDTTTAADGEERKHYLEPVTLNEIPLWLTPCHIVASIFQIMQAFVLFAFSKEVETRSPLYTNYRASYNLLLEDEFGTTDPQQVGKNSLTVFSAITALVTALAHLIIVLPGIRPKYEYYLQRSQSPYRWMEYVISAAIMRVQVAQIAGVTDIHLLFCIFGLCSCCILYGMMFEPLNARARADSEIEPKSFHMHYIGLYGAFLVHGSTWAVIMCYFVTGIRRGDPPGYVGTILASLFLLELTFPATLFLQWKKIGYYRNYIFGEFTFIMLSFTAKTFLAWITYGTASSTRLQE